MLYRIRCRPPEMKESRTEPGRTDEHFTKMRSAITECGGRRARVEPLWGAVLQTPAWVPRCAGCGTRVSTRK